jgi:putative nucleotidyltransferase with HDIG domain
MKAYQALLFVLGSLLAFLAMGHGLGSPLVVVGLAVAAVVAERGRVRLANATEVSISLVPTVFAAAVFGPLAAMLVAVCSLAGDFPVFVPRRSRAGAFVRGAPFLKWGVYTCVRAVYAAAAGFSAVAVSPYIQNRFAELVVATAVAAVVAEVLDIIFAGVTAKLRGAAALQFLRMLMPIPVVAVSLYGPIVALLAVAYEEVSPWTLALFFIPALAAQRLFSLYREQRWLTDQLVEVNEGLERANLSFASALVATIDARDRYTAGHSTAVAIYACDIAERMGLTAHERQLAHLCGLVHDVGKIGLPPGLLEKTGPLTLEERREMQHHSAIGERILANVDTYAEIASIVRHHHERIDGQGYPDGLRGERIPLISRIIAVADAYNAMTSDRPYRDAMPSRVARLRLAQAVESQFDTTVVAAFEAILASSTEAYRLADFGLEAEPSQFGSEALEIHLPKLASSAA